MALIGPALLERSLAPRDGPATEYTVVEDSVAPSGKAAYVCYTVKAVTPSQVSTRNSLTQFDWCWRLLVLVLSDTDEESAAKGLAKTVHAYLSARIGSAM